MASHRNKFPALLTTGLVTLLAGSATASESPHPPMFAPPTPHGVVSSMGFDPIGIQLFATDVDGDDLAEEVRPMPEGATLDDSGRFRWTPDYNSVGQTRITLFATDQALSPSTLAPPRRPLPFRV